MPSPDGPPDPATSDPDRRTGSRLDSQGPATVDIAEVYRALERVVDPCSCAAGTPLSLREMGLLREVEERDGVVRVSFGVTGPGCTFLGVLGKGVLDEVGAVTGVRDVQVSLDASTTWHEGLMSDDGRERLRATRRPVELRLHPRTVAGR